MTKLMQMRRAPFSFFGILHNYTYLNNIGMHIQLNKYQFLIKH